MSGQDGFRNSKKLRKGSIWLELLLCLAFVVLVFQLFPNFYLSILSWIDLRKWSRSTWFFVNLVIVFLLVGIRIGPELHASWKERQHKLNERRKEEMRKKELREQREMLERIKEGRRRRVW